MGSASDTADNFCLRWNDFESNVSTAFRDLREDQDFFDVTLACDGGRTLRAHRVILSACSLFFKKMLRSCVTAGQPNPMIYLRGVKLADLESVLDFMYHGEVNVGQDELNSFLAVAEDLQVKGLTQQQNSNHASGPKERSTKGRKSASVTTLKGQPATKKSKKAEVNLDNSVEIKTDPLTSDTDTSGLMDPIPVDPHPASITSDDPTTSEDPIQHSTGYEDEDSFGAFADDQDVDGTVLAAGLGDKDQDQDVVKG